MMEFGLSEEQEMIRDAAKGFATGELSPIARDCDEEFNLPNEVLQGAWDLGLATSSIPESAGGVGMERSAVTSAIVLEELGAGCPSLASAVMSPTLFINPIIDQGTEEQQKEYLAAFTGGDFTAGTMALQEPGFSFDPASMATTAKEDGGDYVISGEKRLVPLADRADHILVVARTGAKNGNAVGFDNLDAFIVPRDASGLSISNDKERTIGFQAVPQYKVTLDNVKVAKATRLGGDAGIDGAKLINSIRVGAAALAVGCSRTVVDYCIPYAKERKAFGSAIAQKQAIAFMLADMHTEVDAMRWMTWKAASHLDAGVDATKPTTLMQNYVQRKAMKVSDDGIQIFGGHGFIREYPVEMWFRHMRNLTILEGPVAA